MILSVSVDGKFCYISVGIVVVEQVLVRPGRAVMPAHGESLVLRHSSRVGRRFAVRRRIAALYRDDDVLRFACVVLGYS
ncbi:hypothetical protein SDC9_174931 [bioreactor metagenome]|uniref:Uncharacterized protein n=1 Tax=bioreactor metagenome TaxID=1076179 RepID=A0A645GKT1_9ZZZZ